MSELLVDPDVNEALLRDAVANIEFDEGQWRQGAWVCHLRDNSGEICGTTMCLAGHIMLAAGYTVQHIFEIGHRRPPSALWPLEQGPHSIPGTAAKLAGLNSSQAWALFNFIYVELPNGSRRQVRLDDLKAMITEVTGIEFKDPLPLEEPV